MLKRCGIKSDFSNKACRCFTPNRCCSSITANPNLWYATFSWISACVPTTTSMLPLAKLSNNWLRAVPFTWPVRSATDTPNGDNNSSSVFACCCAKISVGAIIAVWKPAFATSAATRPATTVFPEPTSPCNNRFIGWSDSKSCRICHAARRWAFVKGNGNWSTKFFTTDLLNGIFQPVNLVCSCLLNCAANIISNNSSNARRSRPREISSWVFGAWRNLTASDRLTNFWRWIIFSGKVSGKKSIIGRIFFIKSCTVFGRRFLIDL